MWPDHTEGVTERTNKGVTHSTQGQGPDGERKKNETKRRNHKPASLKTPV